MIACPVVADSNFSRFPIAYSFVPCPKKHENGLKDLASDLVSNPFAVARSLLSRVDGPLDTRVTLVYPRIASKWQAKWTSTKNSTLPWTRL